MMKSEADGRSDRARREFAMEVVRTLREAGHEALWAGGCVRDLLLGHEPSDYDVATDARPEQVMRLFRRTVPVGVSFGVVRVLGPREVGEVEVATFRSDGAYVDGRRPTSVEFSSPEVDASRRDFTINGMFYDPIAGEVLDYVGGKEDLKAHRLRAIGDPWARFQEDKLRLIRSVRFAARFGMVIEAGTADAIRGMADQIRVVAPERIAQELEKMLKHPSRALGMELVREFGLLGVVLPGLLDSIDRPVAHGEAHGKTVWEQTVRVLECLPHETSLAVALASMFREADPAGAKASARRLDEAGRFLRLSNADRERAAWLVARLPQVWGLPKARVSARKRLLAEPGAGELLELARATAVGTGDGMEAVRFAEDYARELPDGPLSPEPLVTGQVLHGMGWKPGPRFKVWLERAYDAQLEGAIRTPEDGVAWLKSQGPDGNQEHA